MSRAARRGGRYDDGRQVELQVLAPPFVLGRQLQRRAERVGRLVDREPRLIGRDLEEDAARLAEINRTEVLALDDRRHVAAGLDQHLSPVQLVGVVAGTPGHVMDGAGGLLTDRRFGRIEHVEQRAGAAGPGFEAGAVALRRHLAKALCVGEEVVVASSDSSVTVTEWKLRIW